MKKLTMLTIFAILIAGSLFAAPTAEFDMISVDNTAIVQSQKTTGAYNAADTSMTGMDDATAPPATNTNALLPYLVSKAEPMRAGSFADTNHTFDRTFDVLLMQNKAAENTDDSVLGAAPQNAAPFDSPAGNELTAATSMTNRSTRPAPQ